jgi:uncharacterized protein
VEQDLTQITSYRGEGFNINEIRLWGSILAFPRFTLLWDVKNFSEITPASLAILPLIKPRIGTDSSFSRSE